MGDNSDRGAHVGRNLVIWSGICYLFQLVNLPFPTPFYIFIIVDFLLAIFLLVLPKGYGAIMGAIGVQVIVFVSFYMASSVYSQPVLIFWEPWVAIFFAIILKIILT